MAQHDDHEGRALARRQEQRDKLFQGNVDDAIDALLKTANGRDFLWWMFQQTQHGQQPFSGNALTTAFNCGELNVGQKLLARIIEVNPDGYVLMLKEKQRADREPDSDRTNAERSRSDGPDSVTYADE